MQKLEILYQFLKFYNRVFLKKTPFFQTLTANISRTAFELLNTNISRTAYARKINKPILKSSYQGL